MSRRVALVSGAASPNSIGRAAANRLRAQGWSVAVVDRNTTAGDCDLALTADLGEPGGHRAVVEAVVDRFGRLDLLVNAAGIARTPRLLDTDEATWKAIAAINVRGLVLLSAAASRAMLPGASIVHVGSAGQEPAGIGWVRSGFLGPFAAYGASKAAVGSLIRTMAWPLGRRGIRVSGVAPGAIVTDILRHLSTNDEAASRLGMDACPAGRLGHPGDIAGAIAFLASEDAAFVTGTTLGIDGGLGARRGPVGPSAAARASDPPRRAQVLGGRGARRDALVAALAGTGLPASAVESVDEINDDTDAVVCLLDDQRGGDLVDIDAEKWQAAWDASAGRTWSALQHMGGRSAAGRLVVVVPELGDDDCATAAGRAAARSLVNSAADELLGRGVLVNAVEAGAVITQVLAGSPPGSDAEADLVNATVALVAGPHAHVAGVNIP